MIRKFVIMALRLTCLALAAVSCIYPFTPETEDGSGALVIEGDILIGKETVVQISRTAPIDNPEFGGDYPSGKVWVEDNAGTVYNGEAVPDTPGKYTVDTRYAPSSREYCLHFIDNDSGKEYVSAFEPVCSAPVIDSLSYNLNYEKQKLNIALSMHSLKESFFKWSYVEDWEYHSDFYDEIKYVPPVNWGNGQIVFLKYDDQHTFTCYKHAVSSRIMIFSTENQTDDRFVDLEFLPIDRTDNRISYLYRIVVDLEPLTKDAYLYWDNVKANSDYTGDLFAPNPSELVGNIRCIQDPDELVMGYINVAEIARKHLVVDYIDHCFWKNPNGLIETVTLGPSDWRKYYDTEGYLPYSTVNPGDVSQTYWAPARCVDCRRWGGTLEKPEDWPPEEFLNRYY